MGHEACVEALLQHGSSFLAQDSRGRSPLHLAAACGHVGVLRALLKIQKSVLVLKDNCGYTPLHWACYNGKSNILLFSKEASKVTVTITNKCYFLNSLFIKRSVDLRS